MTFTCCYPPDHSTVLQKEGERGKVIRSVQEWGDEWYPLNTQDRSGNELAWFPTACQAVAMSDPQWTQIKDDRDDWGSIHSITCIMKGLKKS